jgi:hypothetical protein
MAIISGSYQGHIRIISGYQDLVGKEWIYIYIYTYIYMYTCVYIYIMKTKKGVTMRWGDHPTDPGCPIWAWKIATVMERSVTGFEDHGEMPQNCFQIPTVTGKIVPYLPLRTVAIV